MRKDSGVALLLAAGVVVLLALYGLLFLHNGSLSAAGGAARRDRLLADTAAESGLEYATARLWRDRGRIPSWQRTAANAGDDWQARDPSSAAPDRGYNPSYARGDRWTDLDADGAFTAGVDAIDADLDGNGRFDAYSGRLRGEGMAGPRFRLAVQDRGAGLICVNSGETGSVAGDHDMDGVPNGEDPTYVPDRDANGTPDHRDPEFFGNVHLVNLLDNLGGVLGVPSAGPAPFAPVPPSTPNADTRLNDRPITTSDLGRRIVAGRPRGGYTSLRQLEEVLQGDFAAAERFLTVAGEGIPVASAFSPDTGMPVKEGSKVFLAPEGRYELHVRIDLNSAPVEVLQALLRNIAANGAGPAGDTQASFFVRLSEDEADRVAGALAVGRPFFSWAGVSAVLAASLFLDDPFTVLSDEQAADKKALILAQLTSDGCLPDPFRQGGMIRLGGLIRRVCKPHLEGPLSTHPYGAGGQPWIGSPVEGIPTRKTTEGVLSLAPPGAFSVASAGAGVSSASSRLTAGLVLERTVVLNGQADFDPDPVLAGLGGGRRMAEGDLVQFGLAGREGMQSYPRFSLFSADLGRPNFTMTAIEDPVSPELMLHYRHPRYYGGVQLSARHMPSSELDRALLALPFNEDTGEVSVPYSEASWQDNYLDPASRAAPPQMDWPHGVGLAECHRGFMVSPSGEYWGWFMKPRSVRWDLCPLARDPCVPSAYAIPLPDRPGVGPFREGAIGGWARLSGIDESSRSISFSLKVPVEIYKKPGAAWVYDRADLRTLFTVRVSTQFGAIETHGLAPGGSPSGTTAPVRRGVTSDSWFPIEVRFDRSDPPPSNPNLFNARIYVDGREAAVAVVPVIWFWEERSTPICAVPTASDPSLTLEVSGFDDFAVHGPPYDTATEVEIRAVRDRHDRTGSYTSPRMAFTDRVPEGASITGFEWEADIPQTAGGRLRLSIREYDRSGAPIPGGPSIDWTGGAGNPAGVATPSRPRCGSWELVAEMETDPTKYELVRGQRVLLASPALNEFRLHYADRPRTLWRESR